MSAFAVTTTCDECPWRRDVAVGRFPPERYKALENTCKQIFGGPIFACHKTHEGNERACAGFLLVEGWENISVRLAASAKRFDMSEITAAAPLYGSFAEMAVANGYDPETGETWVP